MVHYDGSFQDNIILDWTIGILRRDKTIYSKIVQGRGGYRI